MQPWSIVVLGGVVVGGLAFLRLKLLKPVWGWTDTSVTLHLGGRLTEVYLAEVRVVLAGRAGLVLRTMEGDTLLAKRWLTPQVLEAFGVAVELDRERLAAALERSGLEEIWGKGAQALRLPPQQVSGRG
ncbi:MAG: hypothetical protein Q8N26_17790 [Myxococcales bacterium]|nr:hypothetical protein [Myxococcales bacterium]